MKFVVRSAGIRPGVLAALQSEDFTRSVVGANLGHPILAVATSGNGGSLSATMVGVVADRAILRFAGPIQAGQMFTSTQRLAIFPNERGKDLVDGEVYMDFMRSEPRLFYQDKVRITNTAEVVRHLQAFLLEDRILAMEPKPKTKKRNKDSS